MAIAFIGRENMTLRWFFLLFVIIFVDVFDFKILTFPTVWGYDYKINIMVTEPVPFFAPNQTELQSKNFDVLIIKTFAEKFKFAVDYLVLNTSLDDVFVTKDESLSSHLR